MAELTYHFEAELEGFVPRQIRTFTIRNSDSIERLVLALMSMFGMDGSKVWNLQIDKRLGTYRRNELDVEFYEESEHLYKTNFVNNIYGEYVNQFQLVNPKNARNHNLNYLKLGLGEEFSFYYSIPFRWKLKVRLIGSTSISPKLPKEIKVVKGIGNVLVQDLINNPELSKFYYQIENNLIEKLSKNELLNDVESNLNIFDVKAANERQKYDFHQMNKIKDDVTIEHDHQYRQRDELPSNYNFIFVRKIK